MEKQQSEEGQVEEENRKQQQNEKTPLLQGDKKEGDQGQLQDKPSSYEETRSSVQIFLVGTSDGAVFFAKNAVKKAEFGVKAMTKKEGLITLELETPDCLVVEVSDDEQTFTLDEVLKTVLPIAKVHRLPTIAITASNDTTTIARLIEAGVADCCNLYDPPMPPCLFLRRIETQVYRRRLALTSSRHLGSPVAHPMSFSKKKKKSLSGSELYGLKDRLSNINTNSAKSSSSNNLKKSYVIPMNNNNNSSNNNNQNYSISGGVKKKSISIDDKKPIPHIEISDISSGKPEILEEKQRNIQKDHETETETKKEAKKEKEKEEDKDKKEKEKEAEKKKEKEKEQEKEKESQILPRSLSNSRLASDELLPTGLFLVEKLTNLMQKCGPKFKEEFPELCGTINQLLEEIQSDKNNIFEPDERAFDQCDQETREWLLGNYTRRVSLPESQTAGGGSLSSSLTGYGILGSSAGTPSLRRSKSLSGEHLKRWDFDIFEYPESQLENLIILLFDAELNLLDTFQVPMHTFVKFVREVRGLYHDNPYHNFVHAVDVMQSLYSLLVTTKLIEMMTDLELFALLIAALCHDLDHPGTNNGYQINAQTPLAILYNDVSPLENHHACLCFKVITTKDETNILANISPELAKEFRMIVIKNILGTDMSHHFDTMNQFKARSLVNLSAVAAATSSSSSSSSSLSSNNSLATTGSGSVSLGGGSGSGLKALNLEVKEDRQFVMKVLLHAADISNQAKPWKMAKRWADAVSKEFCEQGDLERRSGMNVSPGMDRETMNQAQMTAHFIEYVLDPLFSSLVAYFPSLQLLSDNLAANKQRWRELEKKTVTNK